MKKYFRIHDYSRNEKAKSSIYNLNGQASVWWEHLMQVKWFKERRIISKRFKKYFKEKYIYARYSDNKRKDFNELNLGHKSMEEHVHNFLEFLRYVDYIKDKRVKVQCFLGIIP